ncbi:MAG: MFS transporter [Acidilobaceae archaeon]
MQLSEKNSKTAQISQGGSSATNRASTRSRSETSISQVLSVSTVSWVGALTEWLDFYAYAVLAGPIIGPKFFPKVDPIAQLLGAYGALAIGFLSRPLGALLFGKIGDQYGRRAAFVLALMTLFLSTVAMGLLPTYETIGVLAPILLIALRFLQGLGLGGGFGSALVYLGEFVPEHRRGFFTGFLFTTAPAGMGLAMGLYTFAKWLAGDAFAEWGWRLVFFLAAFTDVIIAAIVLTVYKETPIFAALKAVRRVTSAPIREVFSRQYLPLIVLAWIGVVGAHGPIWYTNMLFARDYVLILSRELEVKLAFDVSLYLMVATILCLWMYPLFGYISDKVGRKPILLLGIYVNALWFIIALKLLERSVIENNSTLAFLTMYSLALMNGIGYSGAMSAWLLEIFPARIRISSVALSYNLGYGVTGGLTPLIITSIYRYIGDLYIATLIYASLVPSLMALLFLFKGPETLGVRIWAELSSEKFAKKPLIVPSDMPIRAVAKLMADSKSRVAVLVSSKMAGIVYTRSIVRALAKGVKPEEPILNASTRVECLDRDARVVDAFVIMQDYGVPAVPVCDKDGSVVGVIEERELLNEALMLKSALNKKISLNIKAIDAAPREPIYLNSGAKLKDLVNIIARENVGLVPIVDEEKRVLGVISESDVVRLLATNLDLETPVDSVMRRDVIGVSRTATVRDAAEQMLKHNIRHVVILGEDKKLLGVLSVKDVLRAVA